MSLLSRLALALLLVALAGGVHAGVSAPYQILTNKTNIIVWQEFAPWLMITEDPTAGRYCYWYDHATKSKMTMKTSDPGEWMPLGSAIKWLMYVKNYQGRDRLMAHDVDFHVNYIAWPSMQKQVGCGMAGTKCIFGQYRAAMVGDHYPVDLYYYNVQSGACTSFCVSDSEKSQFAHDGVAIVYRAYYGPGNARIYGINFSGGAEFEIAARDGITPSVCGSLVAWAEVSGAGYNIVAKNTTTGEMRTVAYTTANPPRPQAGRNSVFWQDKRNSAQTGLDIYGYDWQTGQEFPVTTAAGDQTRLRVCDDLVTWVTGTGSYQILWGADVGPYVSYTGAVTGVRTDGSFYCQQQPGVGAVKVVLKSGQAGVSVGQKVTVTGLAAQDSEFLGTVINQATVTQLGSWTAKPYAMANTAIGATNLWMLIKSWGRVSGLSVGGGCRFYITDGSHLTDNSGQGVYVTSPFSAPTGLANGAYVTVEGISRVSRTTGRQIEVVTNGRMRVW